MDRNGDKQRVHPVAPDGIKLYNTFDFRPAVAADPANNVPAYPGEDKENLETALSKFDQHYGNKKFPNIKQQTSFSCAQLESESLIDFIGDLKYKAKQCDSGAIQDSLLCA